MSRDKPDDGWELAAILIDGVPLEQLLFRRKLESPRSQSSRQPQSRLATLGKKPEHNWEGAASHVDGNVPLPRRGTASP